MMQWKYLYEAFITPSVQLCWRPAIPESNLILYKVYRRIWSSELDNMAIGFDTCIYVLFDELCIIIIFICSFHTSIFVANVA
jgi:hypothetical protein